MMPNTSHSEDRETLCALFDGELQGDAERFAHRRLGHDAGWRETVGRWQLAGDVIRQQAVGVAPAGFASRVALALEAERQLEASLPATGAQGRVAAPSRRRWIPGAALAASVAVAALFVARPLGEPDPRRPDAGPSPVQQMASSVPAATDPARDTTADSLTRSDAGTDASLAAAAVAVAAAEVPRRSGERRARDQRQQGVARAARGAQARPLTGEASIGTRPSAEAATEARIASAPVDAASTRDPFHPAEAAGNVNAAKPWPRAVLPANAAQGGYTVGYGDAAPASPSFYPFEPRLPAPEAQAPAEPPPAPPHER